MKLNDAQRASMTQDELDMIDGKTERDTAPVGADQADEVIEAAAEEAPAAEGATETPAEDPAPQVAAEQPAEQPEPAAEPIKYTVPSTDFAAQRDALRTQKKELLTKWSAGEMTDDDYSTQLDALDEQMATALIEQTRAATLHEANTQAEQRAAKAAADAENAAMAAVAKASKAAGLVDYQTDTAAATQFDALFAAVKLDPANARLNATALVNKAHDAVLALRGLKTGKPQATTPTTPTPQKPLPQTLAHLPSAAAQAVGQELSEQLDAIEDPDVLEAKWASLSAAQRKQMLRATMPATRKH